MEDETAKKTSLRVLCLEDSHRDIEIMREVLVGAGYELRMDCTETEDEFTSFLRNHSYDVIFSDFKVPTFDAFGALRLANDICPDVPFLCVSGSVGEETAIELMKQGAVDYVLKDHLGRLPLAMKRALDQARDKNSRRRAEEALRESERKFRETVDALGEGYYRATLDGVLLECNRAFSRILGFGEPADLVGTSLPDLWQAPDERNGYVQELVAKGSVSNYRINAKTKTGEGISVLANVHLVKDKNNRALWIDGIFLDITERKQIEDELLQSEKRFRKIFEESQIGMYTSGPDYRYDEVNPAFCRMIGYTANELTSMTFVDITHPDDISHDIEKMTQLKRGETPFYKTTKRYLRKSGGIVWGSIVVSSIRNNDGTLLHFLGMIEDITERKRKEEELSKSEQKYRGIFENVQDVYFETALDGAILVVSPSIEIISKGQFHSDDLVGGSMSDYYSVAGARQDLLVLTQNQGSVSDYEIMLKNRDGSQVPCSVSAKVQFDAHGTPLKIVGSLRDITERKRAEEIVRDSEERFRMVFENVFDGISLYDEDPDPMTRRLIECNGRYAAMAGRSREELLRFGNTQRLQRSLEDDANDKRVEGIHEGTAYQGSFSWIRPDGKENIVEYLGMPVTWRGKSYTIGIDRDITERKKAEESNLLLTTALESTANGVVITDIKGNIAWVNKAFTGMTGYAELDVRGQNLRILKSGIHDDSFYRSMWETISAGNVWRGELINMKKDGSLYSEEMTITPLKKANGEITHFIAIKQDITERKNANRELKLMAQTVASARDCITITDLENRLIFVNDAFRNAYGYTTEELLGKDVSMLRSPGTPVTMTDRILPDTLDGGWYGELMNRRKDGTDFPVELWTSVVRDDTGTQVALVGVARDINDRTIAEEHLRESEEQFRLIAENVADMIAVLDLDGKRIYNSPSYRSILGDPESLKGTDSYREIHPEDREKVKQVFQETVRTGVGQRIEYRMVSKDGSLRTIESKGSVIKVGDGETSRVVVVSRDVTEEKLLAAQFLRAQRMESIGTLAGGIAHDLNNVLAPIMMAIEILRDKIPSPGGQKILTTIETSAKRGSDIVKQVLAFGRGVTGDRILVQLKHVVNEVAKIAHETFPKLIEIKTDIPRDLWTVSADPTQMHQVLLNMLVNARDAMPHGGTLSISAENVNLDAGHSRTQPESKPGPYVSIVISDTGTGIPAEIREKIFEPFFTTKEIGMGTGLGLSTTLAIVKSHGGFINLTSEVGKGTTFCIHIPATGAASGEALASVKEDLPMGHGELVLIIDDEAAVREITKETLEVYGYKAMTASDGAEGVALFAENAKDIKVVITDMMMPVMGGEAAIVALHKIRPGVKIIATSGLTDKGKIVTPPHASAPGFLTKPYTAEALLKALTAALE
jgi:PAS domain S-box-containing protein